MLLADRNERDPVQQKFRVESYPTLFLIDQSGTIIARANATNFAQLEAIIQQRLRRVEGQVRGVHRMVDDDAYCIDVLTQISAATKALQAVALELLDEHLAHCVADALTQGGDVAQDKVAEASAAIARLVRS